MKIVRCHTCGVILSVNEGEKIDEKWYCDNHILKKFFVTIKEIHDQSYTVRAKSKEEAVDKVQNGEGEIDEKSFEYNRTMDKKYWTVEKI